MYLRVYGCIICRVAPVSGAFALCLSCRDRELREVPMIINVPEEHERYKSGTLTVFYLLTVGVYSDHSRDAIQAILEAQDEVSRSKGYLQNHRHGGELGEVPASPVWAIPRRVKYQTN